MPMGTITKQRRQSASSFDFLDNTELVCQTAERQVIGCAIIQIANDPEGARATVAQVSPDTFYGDRTQPLFEVIRSVLAQVADPTIHDLATALRHHGHGQGSDVYSLMVDLALEYRGMQAHAPRLAREAAAEVRLNHERRQIKQVAAEILNSQGSMRDVAGLIESLEKLRLANAGTGGSGSLTLVDAVDAWARHDRNPVVPTGLGWFDRPTEGGLPIGGITALVAKPNAGKSPLALQMTLAALTRDPALRAVWGLGEMTLQQMARRTACVASTMLDGCEPVTMQGAGDRSKAARAANVALCNAVGDRLAIVPAPLTVDRIEERVIATGARLVVIDYLQLIRGGDASDRVQELEHIISRIRDLAITRECAVVCISSMASSANASTRIGSCAKGATEIDYAVELLYLGEADDAGRNVTWRCMKARNLEKRDLLLEFDGATQTFSPQGFDEFSSFAPRP